MWLVILARPFPLVASYTSCSGTHPERNLLHARVIFGSYTGRLRDTDGECRRRRAFEINTDFSIQTGLIHKNAGPGQFRVMTVMTDAFGAFRRLESPGASSQHPQTVL